MPQGKQAIGIRVILLAAALIAVQWSSLSSAMPVFARQYEVSCVVCHDAFPRLNEFGESFADNNFRLPQWRETMLDTGDEQLALPKYLPLAVRAQGYVQWREAEQINRATGETLSDANADFQAPYMIKLLSSAPLSEHITLYFNATFAEKGSNRQTIVEDAWFQYGGIAGTDVSAQLGQFQISELMHSREVRLTFQDYYAYRAAGITYDRGMLVSGGVGQLDWALGAVNGNGIERSFDVNGPGYNRHDRMFDNDSGKNVFGRIGGALGPVNAGLFSLRGEQQSAAGLTGTAPGDRTTDKDILGIDLSGEVNPQMHWYAQALWNSWDDFLDAAPAQDYDWVGGFVGLDYIPNERWAFSALHNYAEAGDFDDTGTIYEGIEMNSLTGTAAYYFMRNVKAVLELNVDLLNKERSGPPFVGHQTKEHYLLLGLDVAY